MPKKVFLQGVVLHYFNMEKTSSDSLRLSKCAKSGLHDVVVLDGKANDDVSLNIRNWKYYSMKIVIKR